MSSVELLPRRMTYSELLLLPQDGLRIELYGGNVLEMMPPTFAHQSVLVHTAMVVHEYARRVGGVAVVAPFTVAFSDYDVVRPDVVFYRPERRQLVKPRWSTRDRPDIAVEILSPGTEANDRGRKSRMFARYGVPEYWIIDPDACTLEILSLQGERYETVRAPGNKDNVVISPLFSDFGFLFVALFDNHWLSE